MIKPFGLLAALTVAFTLANPRPLEAAADLQDPQHRLALVVGNSAYSTSPLRNPVNDARAMAEGLTNAGFEVILREDLSQNDMKRAIREFGRRLRNGGVGLFYYAGHGVQVEGRNYLIPVNAVINSEPEVEYESVDVGFVLAQMESARSRLNIVILDACRDNPFARSYRSAVRGLASIDAPLGTLIAYSTAPGSVASDGDGDHGLFTEELIRNLQVPGLKIEDVFKRVRVGVQEKTAGRQVPWESSSLTGDFYFDVTVPEAGDSSEPVGEVGINAEHLLGSWAAEVTYDWGATHSERFNFRLFGTTVQGTASFLGLDRAVVDAVIEGNQLTFVTRSQEAMGGETSTLTHHYLGVVSEDGIAFMMRTEGGSGSHVPIEFTAKRGSLQ